MNAPNVNSHRKLDELSNRFAAWRSGRTSRAEAIPEELWKRAAALVPTLQVSVVAKRLGIDCGKLSQRVQTGLAAQTSKENGRPTVQLIKVAPLHIDQQLGTRPAPPSIEISRPDGSLLRVVGLADDVALASVIGVFVRGMR